MGSPSAMGECVHSGGIGTAADLAAWAGQAAAPGGEIRPPVIIVRTNVLVLELLPCIVPS
jgi:hypothetical protein